MAVKTNGQYNTDARRFRFTTLANFFRQPALYLKNKQIIVLKKPNSSKAASRRTPAYLDNPFSNAKSGGYPILMIASPKKIRQNGDFPYGETVFLFPQQRGTVVFLTNISTNKVFNMKKSLVAAALLSLFVAACGGQQEQQAPAAPEAASPAVEAPASQASAPSVMDAAASGLEAVASEAASMAADAKDAAASAAAEVKEAAEAAASAVK